MEGGSIIGQPIFWRGDSGILSLRFPFKNSKHDSSRHQPAFILLFDKTLNVLKCDLLSPNPPDLAPPEDWRGLLRLLLHRNPNRIIEVLRLLEHPKRQLFEGGIKRRIPRTEASEHPVKRAVVRQELLHPKRRR